MFLLVICLGVMIGFGAILTELSVLRYDVGYCEFIEDHSAISWPILGRFTCHNGITGCYMIPITCRTKSGIEFSSGHNDSSFSWNVVGG